MRESLAALNLELSHDVWLDVNKKAADLWNAAWDALGPSNPDTYAAHEEDYWHLCCCCGVITHAASWSAWQPNPDEETEEEVPWVPSKPGEYDPMMICPSCGWEHRDTDDGSGFYGGTRAEMEEQRAKDLPEQSEWWAVQLQDLLTGQH